jgi:hypothetical protein
MGSHETRFYQRLFEEVRVDSVDKATEEAFARLFVANLGLPIEIVRYAWRLSDLDGDGFLDDAEFCIAAHLMWGWMLGLELPRTVPPSLVVPSKQVLALLREIPLRRVQRVFISYRWDTPNAKGMAVLVRDLLRDKLRYAHVFLDIDLLSGDIASRIQKELSECDGFVPILTKGCYDRCVSDGASDAVRQEVEMALQARAKGKMVVVALLDKAGFNASQYVTTAQAKGLQEPNPAVILPQSMDGILTVAQEHSVTFVHEYPEAWMRSLHMALQDWRI